MILGKKQNGVEENTTIKVIFITEGEKKCLVCEEIFWTIEKTQKNSCGILFRILKV